MLCYIRKQTCKHEMTQIEDREGGKEERNEKENDIITTAVKVLKRLLFECREEVFSF